jgi:hypothetical protein
MLCEKLNLEKENNIKIRRNFIGRDLSKEVLVLTEFYIN